MLNTYKNKLLLCVAALLMSVCNIQAQSLNADIFEHYDDVRSFYEGCMHIVKGQQLYIAKDSVSGRREFGMAMDFLNTDEEADPHITLSDFELQGVSTNQELKPGMNFSYDYADAMRGVKVWYPDGTLRGLYSTCAVKTIKIKAGGFSVYRNKDNSGNCILFAIAEACGTCSLSVKELGSGVVHEGTAYENGTVSFAKWTLENSEDFEFTIRNTSANDATIVIVSN